MSNLRPRTCRCGVLFRATRGQRLCAGCAAADSLSHLQSTAPLGHRRSEEIINVGEAAQTIVDRAATISNYETARIVHQLTDCVFTGCPYRCVGAAATCPQHLGLSHERLREFLLVRMRDISGRLRAWSTLNARTRNTLLTATTHLELFHTRCADQLALLPFELSVDPPAPPAPGISRAYDIAEHLIRCIIPDCEFGCYGSYLTCSGHTSQEARPADFTNVRESELLRNRRTQIEQQRAEWQSLPLPAGTNMPMTMLEAYLVLCDRRISRIDQELVTRQHIIAVENDSIRSLVRREAEIRLKAPVVFNVDFLIKASRIAGKSDATREELEWALYHLLRLKIQSQPEPESIEINERVLDL